MAPVRPRGPAPHLTHHCAGVPVTEVPMTPWSQDMWARRMAHDAQQAADSAMARAADGLVACRMAAGKTTALLALGLSTDVIVTWKTPFPSAVYTVEAVEGPGMIGQATLSVKSQTAAGCVITVTAVLAIAAGSTVLAHGYA